MTLPAVRRTVVASPRARGHAARKLVVALALAAAGCHAQIAARAPEATLALAVPAADRDAVVFVDGYLAGRAADLARHPLGLRAGHHRVELRADGKLSAYRDVTVRKGESARLAVALHDDLDARDAAADALAAPDGP